MIVTGILLALEAGSEHGLIALRGIDQLVTKNKSSEFGVRHDREEKFA